VFACFAGCTAGSGSDSGYESEEQKLVGTIRLARTLDTEQISESLGLLIRSQKVSLNHLAQFREDVESIIAAHAAQWHSSM